ncbi:PREDICTED: uncharacterized protein LOC107194564 [Dufourea novaeangliae]|uniref:uncharacterized protein LOC107194564 n=1 Tax=Dufourea novaeangliae TaxID=178035 RepID=UPI000767CB3B|nr:PREDICTED: uncharacterized protein LOC107194564 [Dufourea novaeangliae]
MFGRQIFSEPVDDHSEQRRRNEYHRRLLANRTYGTPCNELTRIPCFTNDGLTLGLNFIVFEDIARTQPHDLYLRAHQTACRTASSQYLLEYIRQMEERYAAMERELTRTKMLLPIASRNTFPVHQTAQTDVNRKECCLARKYGHTATNLPGNRGENPRNHERMNFSSRRKQHVAKKVRDSTGKIVDDTNWTKSRNFFQNSYDDIYPMRDPGNQSCRPKTLNSNSTSVCSTHNVAVILPQDSIKLTNVSRGEQNSSKVNNDNIFKNGKNHDVAKVFDNSKKSSTTIKRQMPLLITNNTLMEAYQRFDKKHEPEASYCTDFDIKYEDHTRTNLTGNPSIIQPMMESRSSQDDSEQKSGSDRQGSCVDLDEKLSFKQVKFLENAPISLHEDAPRVDRTIQDNRSYPNNRPNRLNPERVRFVSDQSKNLTRLGQKCVRAQKRIPTPRSNVHTASTPMVQPTVTNPMSDPNGFTIQLLRLAVLLYAPTLMPALNSLIAQQTVAQTSIPIPCFEGSNDLLTQVFRVLNNQQYVPNLSYASNCRFDENSGNTRIGASNSPRSSSSNPEPGLENVTKQLDHDINAECPVENGQERNSIGVNTTLESYSCNHRKLLNSDTDDDSSHEKTEGTDEESFEQSNNKILSVCWKGKLDDTADRPANDEFVG